MPARYRPIQLLGQGARARVWLAEGPDGPCVVKVALHGQSLAAQRDAHRAVTHPAIAPCLDADAAGTWMVVPHLALGPVDLWARGQPLDGVLAAAHRLADGLARLHAAGLVHGDVKPANVLVGADGGPRFVDVGDPGGGTPGWRAPEVERGAPLDPRTDVYGLGAAFYTMIAHRPPFPGVSGYGRGRLPEPPSSARPRIPRALEELILAMLAPSPEGRPTAGEAAAVLDGVAGTDPVTLPVFGMAREREVLRRALADVLEGHPRVVVVHGAPGSGRRTLIREILQAARRLAVPVLDRASPAEILARTGPGAVALDGALDSAEPLALRLLQGATPTLALLHSAHSHPALARKGALHVRPPPLSVDEVATFLEWLGRDRRTAEDLHRRTRGLPPALLRAFTDPRRTAPPRDPRAAALVDALRSGPQPVPALAHRLGLSEHTLLDLAEPLLDEGVLGTSPDGFVLSLTRG